MNIFWLDNNNLVTAAQYHCDRHVVKMIVEYAQLLSTAHHVLGSNLDLSTIYKPTHINHPCAVWARKSKTNYNTLTVLAGLLCKEYTLRYGKTHKTEAVITRLGRIPLSIPLAGWTPPPQCVPDDCKVPGDTEQAYRNYYMKHKRHIAKWTNRETPEWYV